MMKMTRKMAAMVAAMMAVTSIGAISAFAETITGPASSYPEDSDRSGNVSVELWADVTQTPAYVPNPIQAVWNINVDTSSLEWKITVTDSGTYDIVWDPVTQSYGTTSPLENKRAVITEGSATKYIRVTNKSNFDITSHTTIRFDESALGEEMTDEEVFNVQEITGLPGRGDYNANVGDIGITLTDKGLTLFEGNMYGAGKVRLPDANFYFTKGDVYTYNQ